MNRNGFLPAIFFIGIGVTLFGACLRIMHFPNSELLMGIGIAFSVAFIVLAIREVFQSAKLDGSQKTMWILSLILLGGIAGIVYILMRKNINGEARRHIM